MDDSDDRGGELSRDLLAVLLGEGIEYVGEEPVVIARPRRENIDRICRLAVKRVGDGIASPGNVPPAVVAALFGDGSYVADPLSAAYWAGAVACSRTAVADDDRAGRILKLLARLGTRQIRAHYLFYATLRRLLGASDPATIDFDSKRYRMAVFVPAAALMRDMDFRPEELSRLGQLLHDVLAGLGTELLLDGSNTGSEEYLKRFFASGVIRGEGVVFAPSLAGINLFLWAFGAADRGNRHFLSPLLDATVPGIPPCIDGAGFVYDDM